MLKEAMATLANQELPERSVVEELADIDAAFDQDDEKLQERVDYGLARLRGMGVICDSGDLVDTQIPPDMQEWSECDVG